MTPAHNLPALFEHRPELIVPDAAQAIFTPDILRRDTVKFGLVTGVSLLATIRRGFRDAGYPHIPKRAVIWVADSPMSAPYIVPRKDWGTFLVRHGMYINVTVPFHGGGGGGGKSPMATVLSLVVMVAAVVVSIYFPPAIGLTGYAATMVGSLAAAAVMYGGMMLVNAICPPSMPKLKFGGGDAGAADKVWSISGTQNKADLYGVIPLVLGRVRFAPRLAAQPYTYLNGNNEFARYLYIVAGNCAVYNPRIGDTDFKQFSEARMKVHQNYKSNEKLEFFPSSVYQEHLGVLLSKAAGWTTRTSAIDATELYWEIHFSQGLVSIGSNGTRNKRTVSFQAEYRKVGTSAWYGAFGSAIHVNGGTINTRNATPSSTVSTANRKTMYYFNLYFTANGSLSVSGGTLIGKIFREVYSYNGVTNIREIGTSVEPNFSGQITTDDGYIAKVTVGDYTPRTFSVTKTTTTPQRFGWSKKVTEGQYELRLRRITGDAPKDSTTTTIMDEATWQYFKTFKSGPVLNLGDFPCTVIEMEIKATDQLNGHVNEFNAEFSSVCPVWNGSKWVNAESSNPASLCLMLATTPVISKTRMKTINQTDKESWQEYYLWCEKYGWKFNSVEVGSVYVRELVHSILSAGRASYNLDTNGRFSVVWDALDKPYGFPFGPRNAWGFSANKGFVKEKVHGLRMRFLNKDRDFQEDELIVYADGYNAKNATNIIEWEQDGVTDPKLIYKHGRLRLADSEWRPEVYTFNTDFASVAVRKGDRCPITYDVPMWGICQARVAGVEYTDYPLDDMAKAALVALCITNQARIDGQKRTLTAFTSWLNEQEEEDLRVLIVEAGIKNEENVVAVVIDDMVTMEEGKQYAFNYYYSVSGHSTFSVVAESGTSNILRLLAPIPTGQAPAFDGLIHFGEADSITHDVIVVAIEPSDNSTAKITCQDYSADKIYQALTGPIPPWESDITLPSRWQLGRPNAPAVLSVITNETALLVGPGGKLSPRIQVGFSIAARKNVTVQTVVIEYRHKETGGPWMEGGRASAVSGVVFATGVLEQEEYEFRLYAISSVGIASDFSPIYETTIIGRYTPPPPPVSVFLDGNRVWWVMPEIYPVDVRGWQIFVGFDHTDSFAAAKLVTNGHVTEKQFDISAWAGRARRVWVRTVDDIGLVSEPRSVVINLGDGILEDNVFYEVKETERQWPGVVIGGTLVEGEGLVQDSATIMWGDLPMWGDSYMWGGEFSKMVYTTFITVPWEADTSNLIIDVLLAYGTIESIEFGLSTSYPAWGDLLMWGDLPWSGVIPPVSHQLLPDRLRVEKGQRLEVKITMSDAGPACIQEILWKFDVEDAMRTYDDIVIPAGGYRLPVEDKEFRWVKNIVIGLQYTEDTDRAYAAGWVDKGIVDEAGFVINGPLIQCKDINGNLVAGVVDVTLQGARGV